MTHTCPVCRARLWRRPLARRLQCPRCGAEFRPTVSLFSFQILFFLFLLVCLAVVIALSGNYLWLTALLGLILIVSAIFLPRLVRLEPDSGSMPIADGPGPDELNGLRFKEWEGEDEPPHSSVFLTVLIIFSAVLLGWLILHFLT